MTIHGRFEGGFGWLPAPQQFMERACTALGDGRRVWLFDPERAPDAEAEIGTLGTVAGVVLTLGRHERDVAWFARRFDVPVYVPRNLGRVHLDARVEPVDDAIPDSPLRLIHLNAGRTLTWWRESAVWWPERRILVCGESVGTAQTYLLPGERLAVHPVRRLAPPVELLELNPERLYVGHGPGLSNDVAESLRLAVQTARPRLPAAWWHSLRVLAGRIRRRSAGPSR